MRAFRDARYICLGLRLDGIPDDGYARRMEIFHGPGWRDRGDDEIQTSDAAAYQQAVALTRLLASPCWRERILGKDRLWPEEFEAEVRRAVAPGYIWGIYPRTRWPRDRDDPLLEWRYRTRRLESGPLPPGHTPGACPKPSGPAAATPALTTRKLRDNSGQRDIQSP